MFVKKITDGEQRNVGKNSWAWLLLEQVGTAGHFGITYLEPHDAIPLNIHTYDEIFYIISGSATISIAGQEQIAEAESVILVPKGTEHLVMANEQLLQMLFINIDA